MRALANFIFGVGVIAVLIFPLQKNSTDSYDSYGIRLLGMFSDVAKIDTNFFKTTGDLLDFSIPKNSVIAGEIEASGILKGDYFFEANARGMLLDANKNVLKTFPIMATSDWQTTDGVPFTMTIDATGVTPGPGFIRIQNDNPTGDVSKDKFIDVPVVIN